VFKEHSVELGKEISACQAKITTINNWLDKYEKTDLTIKTLKPVEALDDNLAKQVTELELKIANVDKTNRKISQNNTYKEQLANINITNIPLAVDAKLIKQREQEATTLAKTIKDSEQFIAKLNKLHGVCPTCFSAIDGAKVQQLISEHTAIIDRATGESVACSLNFNVLSEKHKEYTEAVKRQEQWEKLHLLIDHELPATVLDKNELQTQYNQLAQNLQETQQRIKLAEEHNSKAQQHNSRVETIKQQLQEMSAELEEHSFQLSVMNERMSILQVLAKTFSTTGLVAYKIECLVKDLEDITNRYLVDLSDGRFQIAFRVNSSDKLNVVITDNGRDIDINALSGGEKARVNVATLLAIRKLMQTLSASRINLLILDETVEALDVEGKDKLVDVLLAEEHLNTVLVSHSFTHPLIEKVNVIKHNNISRIEG
jgi:DNA repair exonuclease SbcCD ATPase subunit